MWEASEPSIEIPSVADLLDLYQLVVLMQRVSDSIVASPHSPDIVEVLQLQASWSPRSSLQPAKPLQHPELSVDWELIKRLVGANCELDPRRHGGYLRSSRVSPRFASTSSNGMVRRPVPLFRSSSKL